MRFAKCVVRPPNTSRSINNARIGDAGASRLNAGI